MRKKNIDERVESRVCFEQLEDWVRERIQGWVQGLLEEEVRELLGRERSERRKAVDAPPGYRNGHGKPRRLTLSCGTIAVRRPRVRDVEERFESRVLPLFAKRTREVRELIPELYPHGLAQGDFDLASRGLFGEEAPLSGSTVSRLKEKWQAQWALWQSRSLEDREVVDLWADGVYVKVGLEKDKAAILVIVATLSDGRKVVVSITSGYRESTQSWSEVLRDLKRRGMNCPRLVVADGHLGIWKLLSQRLSRGGRATLLEPSDCQCPGEGPQTAVPISPVDPAADPLCRNTPGSGAAQEGLPTLVSAEGTRTRGRASGSGLGTPGGLLQLSESPLAASQDHQSGGVSVCCPAASHGRRQAVQEGRQCPGHDLEDAPGRREAVPPFKVSSSDARRLSRSHVRQRNGRQPGLGRESCLMLLHTY